MLRIQPNLSIDEAELEFRATTAQGPGGQHVNRSQTRIDLLWDLDASSSVTAQQRARIHARLGTRISREGVLRVSSQKHRSQARNRDAAIERFVELLREALHVEKPRRPTRPTSSSKRRRLDEKKRRGGVKKGRQKPVGED